MLDRWSVSVVTTGKGGFRKAQKDRQLIMNNYLGIGVDGQVALDFHKVFEISMQCTHVCLRVCTRVFIKVFFCAFLCTCDDMYLWLVVTPFCCCL